jgi:uncharacterized protein involved in outer membrane biogenesis
LIPSLARPRLEALITEAVGKPVTIGGIHLNPFALSLSVSDVALAGDADAPMIAFEELYADVRAASLLRMAVVLDSVHLQAPRVQLILDKQGHINLAQLFASKEEAVEPTPAEPEANAELFPISISSATIDAGQLVFRDEQPAKPFELTLAPVTLELKELTTRRNQNGTYVITARTEKDGSIDWHGDLSIDPFKAQGEIALDKVRARMLSQYAGAAVPFGVKSGTLGVRTKFTYDDSGHFSLGPGDISVDGLELREAKDAPPFLTLPKLQVAGIEIDLDKETVQIASVHTNGARLKAWLGADGALGPPALFGGSDATAGEPNRHRRRATKDGRSSAKWRLRLQAFEDRLCRRHSG